MSMKALAIAPGNTATVQDLPLPEPGPNEIRIKVHSVALNPIDAWFTWRPMGKPGRVVGCDIAGVVEKLGPGASQWKVGDRVAGFVQGATSENERPGGFAQYTIAEEDLVFAIPSEVSFDEAATVPVCAVTAAQALFIRLKINAPFASNYTHAPETAESPAILIYSAATSLGLYVLELAKHLRTPAGKPYRIFATASPKNHAKLLKQGVDQIFDYRDPEWPARVKAASGGIKYGLDCISEGDSTAKISQTYVDEGGVITCFRPSDYWNKEVIREGVEGTFSVLYVGLGKEIVFLGHVIPPDPEWRAFTVAFYKWLSSFKDRLPIAPNPARLMPGGLERIVQDGLTLLASPASSLLIDRPAEPEVPASEPWLRPVSGEKLVYRI
ncbi:hypothetical protein EIP91_003402 [Steccherinum ochraceum]|uniref:Enoyl reductase (ER) domain-containing protein n=1 Tax=Steccherinum ochraceum TaxID=92696 RepID=A0A4R0RR83_9APHY|nr:hypothetical protein EIP91_003402 [Steccherinum ochraceum]